MKKVFGVLFLLAGIAMLAVGVFLMTAALADASSREGQFLNEYDRHYHDQVQQLLFLGIGLTIVGFISFVIGIVMVVTKSKTQRKKDAELAALKKMQLGNNTAVVSNESKNENMFIQIEKLGKLREQGLLTEEEFQQQKRKILDGR